MRPAQSGSGSFSCSRAIRSLRSRRLRRRTGRREAVCRGCAWKLAGDIPESVREIVVQPIEPPLDCDIVFSSLPSSVARETEEAFARAGYPVISNSSSYRMDEDVPLLIPEINHEHVGLDRNAATASRIRQRIYRHESELRGHAVSLRRSRHFIESSVSNRRSSRRCRRSRVRVIRAFRRWTSPTTFLPYIAGEEPKVETEAQKILGNFRERIDDEGGFSVSAQCFRVDVIDGHTASVRVNLKETATLEDVVDAMQTFPSLDLHSSPEQFIEVATNRRGRSRGSTATTATE